jgi:hypothetical protein
MRGVYFYADYCSGRIWGLKQMGTLRQNTVLLNTSLNITSFGEDEDSNLYLTNYANGDIYQITDISPSPAPSSSPSPTLTPTPTPPETAKSSNNTGCAIGGPPDFGIALTNAFISLVTAFGMFLKWLIRIK